jgi:hypothetical protein
VVRILKRLLAGWATISTLAALIAIYFKLTLKTQDDPSASHFELVTIFDGTEFRPTTRELTTSKAVTMFGGTQLDLRRAATADGEVQLDVVTVMGGTDITVPDTWNVTVEGTSVMGGHDVRVTDPGSLPADAPRLTIAARTVFGGLRIQARPVLQTAGTV